MKVYGYRFNSSDPKKHNKTFKRTSVSAHEHYASPPPVQALLRHGVTAKPHIRQVQILQVGMLTQGQTEVQLKSHWEGNTTHILGAPKNWENLGVLT